MLERIFDEFLPSTMEMMKWIEMIFKQGIRRPGYPADVWTEQWILQQFQNLGLKDIRASPVQIKKWESLGSHLEIWLNEKPEAKFHIPCFPMPYSSSTHELEGELESFSNNENISEKI